jgi:hypothetical protein
MKIKYLTSLLLFLTLLAYSTWAKPSSGPSAGLEELFPGKLLDSDGKEVSKDALAGKTVGIYFSAVLSPQTWLNSAIKTKRTLKWFLSVRTVLQKLKWIT